ncbi:MAG: hypothetical protein H6923_09595 [Alphaproteobacteria bacterium]|nr:hypothetical protein [Alphaproteobacteria bacterium]
MSKKSMKRVLLNGRVSADRAGFASIMVNRIGLILGKGWRAAHRVPFRGEGGGKKAWSFALALS